MSYYPIIVVLIFAISDWIAAEKKIKPLEYIAKPATMLALLWWMWQSVGLGGSMLWFTLGAIFCLAGDVFLMIPRDMFIFGLLAFLAGHVFYVIGLNNTAPYINLWGGAVVILLGAFLLWLYPKLAGGLNEKGKTGLKIPVLIYSLVISLMVYSALMTWTRAEWRSVPALLVSLGALLFFASDSMLAWDRFINPLSHARLRVMTTYHLGQIGILLGAMLHIVLK
jgi:uncharacterized membrane protein YhhN